MMSTEGNVNNEILGGLEELGLSKYEASAYYNLLGKGMISATEIAYYSNLPRTKIYFILKKLEKKKLVFINYQKPLMFRALSPKDSFDNILSRYEKRIKSLKKIIEILQQINEKGLKNKGIEEKRYLVLNQFSTDSKIIELLKNTNESIDISLNNWGNVILKASKEEILKAIYRGVKVRILFDFMCQADSLILPNAIEKKSAKISTNMFIFDNNSMIIIDNDGTKSAYFDSHEIFVPTLVSQFQDTWVKIETESLKNKNIEAY
ncbi:MAG TPA: helix-turn-helix domain-containing protein [Candidatus Nitrosocosmicus sp.]|jgi:HTH-type transcriptional regulator, sugar sensing transcriptional regulator|nr:helix-turn-helix domain-containing protein [Candidatus Nitrosocosmicus sp.]